MRRKKTEDGRNWREWLESRPLVVLVGVAVAVCSATETVWDVSKVLVSQSQVKALGSDFVYFGDLQSYLAVPKSEAWTFKQMSEADFLGMIWGPKWLKELLETPLGRMMSGYKIYCWRGPDVFEIETGTPELPVFHAFPFVFIERVNNRKMREDTGKFIDEQELEAKQKAAAEAKRTLDQKGSKKAPVDMAATSPSASATASPRADESPGALSPSDAEAKEAMLNLLLDSDIVGYFLNYNLSGVIETAAIVKGASFGVLNAEKKGNVFYIHSQVVFPASGPRPKIYLDKESICIGDSENTVIIQTCAPSIDQRPPEAPWIYSFLAGLRVVLR